MLTWLVLLFVPLRHCFGGDGGLLHLLILSRITRSFRVFHLQPRSQDLSSYRPLRRAMREKGLSSLASGGGKMRDPGNKVGIGFASLSYAIGAKNSRHLFIQSEVKAVVTRPHAFSRASRQLEVITSSFDWFTVFSVSFVIG